MLDATCRILCCLGSFKGEIAHVECREKNTIIFSHQRHVIKERQFLCSIASASVEPSSSAKLLFAFLLSGLRVSSPSGSQILRSSAKGGTPFAKEAFYTKLWPLPSVGRWSTKCWSGQQQGCLPTFSTKQSLGRVRYEHFPAFCT